MEAQGGTGDLESFLRWAGNLGISDHPSSENQSGDLNCSSSCLGRTLLVSDFPDSGGRGLAAARDIRKGELILKVPKRALITSESFMMKDELLCASFKVHSSLSFTQRLTVALLNEVNKGKRSYLQPYLNQLPRAYEILASFGEFEVQALQVDNSIWAAERAIQKAKSEWEEAKPLFVELKLKPGLVTFKAWLWAAATISSRTMHIPMDGAGCLCPVGDFFNYVAPGEESDSEKLSPCTDGFSFQFERILSTSEPRLTDAGYDENSAAYCFYARKNYRAKDQVLLSYGTYTNMELLEHYGFLLNDNPNDKAFIPLGSEIYSLSSCSNELLYINKEGMPSFALLSVLRLWATPPNKRRSVGHLAYSGHQISTENEVTVMRWLVKTCQDVLDNLPTSIEQDQLLLSLINKLEELPLSVEGGKSPSSSYSDLLALLKSNGVAKLEDCSNACLSRTEKRVISRWKLSVLWRLGYKRMLLDCILHCTERLEHFKSQLCSSIRNS